jgi:hypothetical protein
MWLTPGGRKWLFLARLRTLCGLGLFALANMDVSRCAWPGSRLHAFRASRTREADRAVET